MMTGNYGAAIQIHPKNTIAVAAILNIFLYQ